MKLYSLTPGHYPYEHVYEIRSRQTEITGGGQNDGHRKNRPARFNIPQAPTAGLSPWLGLSVQLLGHAPRTLTRTAPG